jgi:hypothetical protein
METTVQRIYKMTANPVERQAVVIRAFPDLERKHEACPGRLLDPISLARVPSFSINHPFSNRNLLSTVATGIIITQYLFNTTRSECAMHAT